MSDIDPNGLDEEAKILWHVAVHETGHAIIGTALGLHVLGVRLERDGRHHGLTDLTGCCFRKTASSARLLILTLRPSPMRRLARCLRNTGCGGLGDWRKSAS